MKKVFMSFVLLLFGLTATAQLTEGNPTAKQIKVGNRAEAGDFGLYIGASANWFEDIRNGNVDITPIPLVNVKYMLTDRLEGRVGLEFFKTREKVGGDEKVAPEKTDEYKAKYVKTDNRILPGIAYHFAKSNVIDVYGGAEVLVGWSRLVSNEQTDKDNYINTKTCMAQLGAGLFFGLQAYIGDLPLALGLEYGIYAKTNTGGKTRTAVKAGGDEQVVYTAADDFFDTLDDKLTGKAFDKLSASKAEIGNELRFTLTYFFNK